MSQQVYDLPAVLIAFPELSMFQHDRQYIRFRSWVLDSGAYAVARQGRIIDLGEYIETCQELLRTDPTLDGVFALDVIGDWRASLKNTEEMHRRGVPAIPTYHYGEPLEVLLTLKRQFPRFAIGGLVGCSRAVKIRVLREAFRVAWPARIHGFGIGDPPLVLGFPFDSADSSTWSVAPRRYGRWAGFSARNVRGYARQTTCATEIAHYLELERRARKRWGRLIERELGLTGRPVKYLALGNRAGTDHYLHAMNQLYPELKVTDKLPRNGRTAARITEACRLYSED